MAPRRVRKASPAGSDGALDTLDRRQLLAIDRAIDRAVCEAKARRDGQGSARKRRKVENSGEGVAVVDYGAAGGFVPEQEGTSNDGGGFIVDDEDSGPAGGGFIVEDDDVQMGGGFLADEGTSVQGGGFLVEDEPAEPAGGGFLPDDSAPSGGFISTEATAPTVHKQAYPKARSIPLRLVPKALKLLSLPSADPDVLEIFEEAASSGEEDSDDDDGGEGRGDGRRRGKGKGREEGERRVGRKEFAKVCAVLMQDSTFAPRPPASRSPEAEGVEEEDDADGQAFRYEEEEEYEDDRDAEYAGNGDSAADDSDGPTGPGTRRATRSRVKAGKASLAATRSGSSSLSSAGSDDADATFDPTKGKGTAKEGEKAKGKKGKARLSEAGRVLRSEGKANVKATFGMFFDTTKVDPTSGSEMDAGCASPLFPRRPAACGLVD